MRDRSLLLAIVVLASANAGAGKPHPTFTAHSLPLPGGNGGLVVMDYIAYDAAHKRVWVPAGNTGSVDVVEVGTDKIVALEGFKTAEMERNGRKRVVGPSSATVGDGVVFVGNRGDSSVCAFDAGSLARGPCVTLESMPDGLSFVASKKELWVTTPRDKSIVIIDASDPARLAVKEKVSFPGEPEGFAVDNKRGVFFTNLEDTDKTLVIDIATRKTVKTWLPACGEDGPKGLAVDLDKDLLMVACPDHVKVLDVKKDGKLVGRIDTGAGVDNIDYVGATRRLYVGAARVGRLTVAQLQPDGKLTGVATVNTTEGARNGVATDDGTVYLTDAQHGAVLVVLPK